MRTGSLESDIRVKVIVLHVVHLILWVTTLLPGKYILPNLPARLYLWVIIQKDVLVEEL